MKKLLYSVPVCLLISLLAIGSVKAADVAVPSAPRAFGGVGAAWGPAGEGFPVGKFAALLNYTYAETDGVRLHDDELHDNVKLTKNVGVVKFRYGIAPGLDIRTSTPIYDVKKEVRTTGSTDHFGWLGDTAVALHKVVMDQSKGAPFSLAFDLGVILPTADGGKNNNDYIGNQAWGGGAGVGLTYFLGANRFDQELYYYTFIEGEHDYQKPDMFRCLTAWAYALNKNFDIGVESYLGWDGESEKFDQDQNDAKWEWYVGPKVVFKHKESGTTVGMLVSLPVYRDYDSPCPSDGFRFEIKLAKVF
jgi:hypothetical protein